MLWYILIGVIVAIAASLYSSSRKKQTIRIEFSGGGASSTPEPVSRCEPLQIAQDTYRITSLTTFPITIANADRDRIDSIIAELIVRETQGIRVSRNELPSNIARACADWVELAEYISTSRPLVELKLNELHEQHGWSELSEADKRDLAPTLYKMAVEALPIIPYKDPTPLLSVDLSSVTQVLSVLDKYGTDLLYIMADPNCFSYATVRAPSGTPRRERFDRLVAQGLAYQGAEISIEERLSVLSLKEMQAVAEGATNTKFARKEAAKSFLLTLPDLETRLSNVLGYREVFKLKEVPIETSSLTAEVIDDALEFLAIASELLIHTYRFGTIADRSRARFTALHTESIGWEIAGVPDTKCSHCKQLAGRKYSKGEYPTVPFHIGCRCSVLPIIDGYIPPSKEELMEYRKEIGV